MKCLSWRHTSERDGSSPPSSHFESIRRVLVVGLVIALSQAKFMGNSASSFLLLLLAGLVWGTTTPLIKRGSDRIKRHATAEDRGDSLSHPDSLAGKKGRKSLAWWQVLLRDWEVSFILWLSDHLMVDELWHWQKKSTTT